MRGILDETYSDVLKSVRSILARHEFRRKGVGFYRRAEQSTGIIAFQRSRHSPPDQINFTVNVAIICDLLLDQWERQRPPDVWNGHIIERLGSLSSPFKDVWWTVTPTTDVQSLMEEIGMRIECYAVPFIEQYLDPREMIELWESGQSPGKTDFTRRELLAELKSAIK